MFSKLFKSSTPSGSSSTASASNACGPQITPYQGPLRFSGEVVADQNTLYVCAAKKDFVAFRLMVDSMAGFTLRFERAGVYVWDQRLQGEANILVKTFATYDNCPPEVMYDMLHDPVYRVQWDESRVDSYKVTQLNANNEIGVYVAKLVRPISNRMFLNQRAWHDAGRGEYIIMNTSVTHASVPETRGVVRAFSKISGYLVRPWGDKGGCSVSYLTQSDPRGWIPSTFVNYVTTRLAPSVMEKLRKASVDYVTWRGLQTGWKRDWACAPDPWEIPAADETPRFIAERLRLVASGAVKEDPVTVASPADAVFDETPPPEEGAEDDAASRSPAGSPAVVPQS